MSGTKRAAVLGLAVALTAASVWWLCAQDQPQQDRRQSLTKAAEAGNFKDAFDGLKKLALDPKDDPLLVGKDMQLAVNCLLRLGRIDELDGFVESVVTVHKDN